MLIKALVLSFVIMGWRRSQLPTGICITRLSPQRHGAVASFKLMREWPSFENCVTTGKKALKDRCINFGTKVPLDVVSTYFGRIVVKPMRKPYRLTDTTGYQVTNQLICSLTSHWWAERQLESDPTKMIRHSVRLSLIQLKSFFLIETHR